MVGWESIQEPVASLTRPGIANKSHPGPLQSKQVAILRMLQGQEPTKSGPISFKRKALSLYPMLALGFDMLADSSLRDSFKTMRDAAGAGLILRGLPAF